MTNFYRFRGYEFRVDVDSISKIMRKNKSPTRKRRRKRKLVIEEPSYKTVDSKGDNDSFRSNFQSTQSKFNYPLLSFEESSAKSYKQSFYKAQQKILSLEKSNDDLKKTLEAKGDENRRLLEKIRKMRVAFQSNYEIYTLKISEREEERETYIEENQVLKEKLKRLQVRSVAVKQKKESIGHVKFEVRKLQQKLEKIQEENKLLEKRSKYYEESLQRLERKLQNDEQNEDNMFFSKLEEMVKEKSDIYETERKELSEYTIGLQKKLASKNEEAKKLRKNVKTLKDVCETLRKRIKAMMKGDKKALYELSMNQNRKQKGDSREKSFLPKLTDDNSRYKIAVNDM